MLKRSLFALALAAALPMSAQAGEVNYNFIQAGYSTSDFAGGNFSGYSVDGSFGFSDNFYAFGGFQTGDDFGWDLDEANIGLGWHTTGAAQWFVEAAWLKDTLDFGGGSDISDSGYTVAGGVRGFFGSSNFEGNAKLGYADVGDFGNGITVGLAGIYHFNDTWGAYASYDWNDRGGSPFPVDTDFNTWGLGVRASF